jgi:uncharacterized delta-60 repeat protein
LEPPKIEPSSSLKYLRVNYHSDLTSSIDAFIDFPSLEYLNISHNNLSGSIPNTPQQCSLVNFDCSYNNLSGSIGDFSSATYLLNFNASNNSLIGAIPSINNIFIESLDVSNNKLSDYISGSYPSSLTYFDASNNQLSQSAVDAIITDVINSGVTSGTLALYGPNNATASAEVLASASAILTGWDLETSTAGTVAYAASGSGFDQRVSALQIQGDNKIVLGGYFVNYNGITANYIIRLNSDSTVDTTFDSGVGFNNRVVALAVQSDDKILVGGAFTTYSGSTSNRIIRLNESGSIDTTFNIGTGFNVFSDAIAIQSDDKILVGGAFTTYSGSTSNRIIRLNTDGTIDNTFNIGTGFNQVVNSIAIQSDNKILVGGLFTAYSGSTYNCLIRLNTDGTIDNTFNIGTGFNASVRTLAIQSDDKILVGGLFTTYSGSTANRIIRLNTDGTEDTSFNMGTYFDAAVLSIIIQDNNKILVGGQFTSYDGNPCNCIARLDDNGAFDTSFYIGSGFAGTGPYAESIKAVNDIVYVGGDYTSYNGTPTNNYVTLYTKYPY